MLLQSFYRLIVAIFKNLCMILNIVYIHNYSMIYKVKNVKVLWLRLFIYNKEIFWNS